MEQAGICFSGPLALLPEDVDRFLWPFVARSRGRWVRLYTGRKELDHSLLEVFCCFQ